MVAIDTTSHRSRAQRSRPPGGNPPNAIVFHTGEGASASADITELTQSTRASSHYYVTRAGKIFQFVNDSRRASHAGPTRYLGERNWNDFSIGIETEHRKGQSWPQKQLDAIAELLRHLIEKHGIIRERVAAHRWVRFPSSPDHQDPTNFPDPSLRGFITRLYPQAGRGTLMRVTTNGTSVRRAASRADDPIATLDTGDVIEIEGEVQGEAVSGNRRWMQRVMDQGFVHSSLLAPVEVTEG
ncbi:MAG TPA: peptidoglycan recognition family protein [Longimicrobium sp.]|nr:peptidoglycan recognition family protein [Longimicrobium sp.]